MDSLAFYADVVNYGQVLGLDWTYSPEEVERKLGTEYGEHRQAWQLFRDYGIVEFYWHRYDAAQPWQGDHFTVHLHRLARGTTQAGFPEARRISFDRLRDHLAAEGALLVEVDQPGDDVRGYWQPESSALVLVVAAAGKPPEGMEPGDVYTIVLPHYATTVAVGRISGDQRARRQAIDQARHLLTLGPQARSQWMSRQSQAMETDWWLQQFVLVDHRIRQHGRSRQAWVELRLWLLNEAHAVGIFDAQESAQKTAIFVGGLYIQVMADGLDAILPSADSLVRTCLEAIPVSVEDVRAVEDWRTLDRADMLRLRKARTLTSAAEYHVDRLTDPDVIDRLRIWSELKPRLP